MSAAAIPDAAARARALDPTTSFVVQAPAGSGKTGLLVQRFLALLARVERPEAVLAITFTRKAAAEMRRRILDALVAAAGPEPAEEFQKVTWRLAVEALARSDEKQWDLVRAPSRLQVFTIDSFCARVVGATPFLTRLGSVPRTVDNADPLLREAVRRTLAPGARDLVAPDLEVLLERSEMKLEQLEEQLVSLLDARAQWGSAVFAGEDEEEGGEGGEAQWLAGVEQAFEAAMRAEWAPLRRRIPPELEARIARAAATSRAIGAAGASRWPTLGEGGALGDRLEDIPAWKEAAALLRKEGKWRSKGTRDPDVYSDDASFKADFKALLADVAEFDRDGDLAAAMEVALSLPSRPAFGKEGRAAVRALFALMRHAYANLWSVFRERGEVDHTEVALRAVRALDPGETLDRLDARVEHVLVDEFQDTNALQCNLLRGLLRGWQDGDGRTLFLVGDPMQSIYRFRKAEVGVFLEARSSERFLDTVRLERLVLCVNFRSTARLVDWCNLVFASLLGDRDDAVRSLVAFAPATPGPAAAEGVPVEVLAWQGTDGSAEDAAEQDGADPASAAAAAKINSAQGARVEAVGLAAWIAGECLRRRDASGMPPRRVPVAVLVRTRAQALPLIEALSRQEAGLRVRATGIDTLGERSTAIDLEALVRALVHPGDRLAWLALLRSPRVGLALADLSALVEHDVAAGRSTPVPSLLRDETARMRLGDEARARVDRLLAIMDQARVELVRRGADLAVRSAWLRLGGPLGGFLASRPLGSPPVATSGATSGSAVATKYVGADAAALAAAARLEALEAEAFFGLLATHARGSLVDLDALARALKKADAPADSAAAVDVEVMTIHKAKGLEFEVVVLPSLTRSGGRSKPPPLALETRPSNGALEMVAPQAARGRDDDDGDKHKFLSDREKARDQAEGMRLLYVAATRAREKLVLSFAAQTCNKKDGAASKGSALAAFEGVPGACERRLMEVARLESGVEAAPPPGVPRLPAGFAWTRMPASVADRALRVESPSAVARDAVVFATTSTAAQVGTVFHRFAERIAAVGGQGWDAARVAAAAAAVEHELRSEGVRLDELAAATARVQAAVAALVGDEKGLWLVAPHAEARSEWAVTGMGEGTMVSAVIDRTFVDGGVRWIADYKTGGWDGEADAVERCASYVPQLASYRSLVARLCGDALPIRLGLFFPEWPEGRRWRDVTELVGTGQAPGASGPE